MKIIKTVLMGLLLTTAAMGAKGKEERAAEEKARLDAQVTPQKQRADKHETSCAVVKDALVGGAPDNNCENLGFIANLLQDAIDGTKDYITSKPRLANGKEFSVKDKVETMYAATAEVLGNFLWGFLTQVRTQHRGPGLFDYHNSAADLDNGGTHFSLRGANANVDLLTLLNEDLVDIAAHVGRAKELIMARRAVLIAYYVLSLLKTVDLSKIAIAAATNDGVAGPFTQAQLTGAIAKQLWIFDTVRFMDILALDIGSAVPGTLPDANIVVREKRMGGYRLPCIEFARVLANFEALVGR